MNKKNFGFKKPFREADNFVLEGQGFFISYLDTSKKLRLGNILAGFDNLRQLLEPDVELTTGAETALVNEKDNKKYILKGDFRQAYAELMSQGFDACFEFYKSKKPQCISPWSADYLQETL